MSTTGHFLTAATAGPVAFFVVILTWRVITASIEKENPVCDWSIHSNSGAEVLMPGVVLIRNALTMDEQMWVTRKILAYGHGEQKLWKKNDERTFELNNQRQGRGRIYDDLKSYSGSMSLKSLCEGCAAAAMTVDPTMPDISPTHLLTMYYTTNRKLGWHRDDGSQDGQSVAPVVSVSVGSACEFIFKDERGCVSCEEPNPKPRRSTTSKDVSVRLESGDVLLFGGPSRRMMHTVQTVHMNSCPLELLQLHTELCQQSPCNTFRNCPPESFRLNLTFRHAPELFGHENDDRFFYFAKSARTFLATAEEQGLEVARRQSVERRKEKARVRAQKKAAKT